MAGAAIESGTQIPIAELDVLWITAGLGCDGETIAMTAATQPSIEDIVLRLASLDSEDSLPQSLSCD